MANATGIVVRALKDMRPLFYVVPFSESTFQTISEVPDYPDEVSCSNAVITVSTSPRPSLTWFRD